MGIDLDCGSKNFNTGYSHWHVFRLDVIRATKSYVFRLTKVEPDLQPHVDYIKHYFDTKYDDCKFIDLLDERLQNALIHLGLCGLYELCNKGDSETYYSPAESHHICGLFDLIWENNSNKDRYVDLVYEVFKYSELHNKNVIVT